MKKTILTAFGALLLTMGAPTHATELDAIQTAITSSSYTGTESYVLSFEVKADGGTLDTYTILTLKKGTTEAGNWGLYTQIGNFLAFDVGTAGGSFNKVWDTSGSWDSAPSTFDNISTSTEGWFMRAGSADNSQNALTGYTITIAGNATSTTAEGNVLGTTTITFSKEIDSVTRQVTVNMTEYLNAQDFQLGTATNTDGTPKVAVNGNSVVSFTVVPEPATATLSLLALAGLAARRRRQA
ncbi:MAG: PEP-CTERM sorting domain-containing protein [Akkermansia sp.]